MGKIVLSKEERKKIAKSLSFVLDDIREMWKDAETDEIRFDLELGINCLFGFDLVINDNKISIEKNGFDYTIRCYLERKLFGRVKRIPTDYNCALEFLKNYETRIKPRIASAVNKSIKDKKSGFDELKEIDQKYDKEAVIEVDLPPSTNQHIIEVTGVGDKKVGVINFGDRTIKIITNGEIVLVNKDQLEMPQPELIRNKVKTNIRRRRNYE